MDETPFLEIDLSDLKSNQIEELKKFHKAYFDVGNILSSANELKYTSEIRTILANEFANPTPELVKLLARQVYTGVLTQKVLEQFTLLVRKSISGHISDSISERLKTALKTETTNEDMTQLELPAETIADSGITTTEEELEGFYIIKSILRSTVSTERITYRDAKSYFAIFIDDNNRKPICRLYLNSPSNKSVAFIDDDKKEVKFKIDNLDEIYKYSDQLIDVLKRYI